MSDSHATSPTFADVTRDVARTLAPPGNLYFGWMSVVALILTAGIVAWTGQIWWGMGMAGEGRPPKWGGEITRFRFLVGLRHPGAPVSPVLHPFSGRRGAAAFPPAGGGTDFRPVSAGALSPPP